MPATSATSAGCWSSFPSASASASRPASPSASIFRELFPRGLTLLDLARVDSGIELAMSHVAARQEIRDLVTALNLPGTKKLRKS